MLKVSGSDLWKRIRQNQDVRYHKLPAAGIGNPDVTKLPDLYLDFKRTISLPTGYLYGGISGGTVERIAVIPAVYRHDLMQRLFGFLSRVGLPD